MPPTPPANRPRGRALVNGQQRTAADGLASTGTHHRSSGLLSLRPPPLKLRKKRPTSDQPPAVPSITPALARPEAKADLECISQTSEDAPIPSIRLEPPSYPPPPPPFAWTSTSAVDESTSQESQGRETREQRPPGPVRRTPTSSKRSSIYRSSQFLDGEGQVDRKKLSIYLSGVLDTTFNVDDESAVQTPLPWDHAQRVSQASNEWRNSIRADAFSNGSVMKCQCAPGTVICQCYSSSEFEHFRRGQGEHKQNASISSTTCFLSIPRARFRSNLGDVEEVDTPVSPPPLMYDSEDSSSGDDFDWSLPNSPTFHDRQMHYQQTPTPAPRQPPTQRAPVPSFSLPFSRGRQIRPRFQADRTSMPWEQPSPTSTVPTLASISTVSTFSFNFRDDDDEAETEYDPFDDGSDVSEIRTFEPIQTAKPVLVHCKGPSPQSIKYGLHHRYDTRTGASYSSTDTFGYGYGYATVSVS
ncbi:hypothetical protein A1O1_04075 [Capronia coronata CBS 617.96]|uniref:Uncharacterized protein n=1 Tax=Capronia coronata CBS 617.96 TaxID=1182541 RepID=W9YEM0_9EURO|nr:uncharacterized protein A1O1_04075 [Capronia coronata CBS 617.96]EXJ90968.1 hypothetical protein A1O1_04075 [Capronia coronata CBS 617.96]